MINVIFKKKWVSADNFEQAIREAKVVQPCAFEDINFIFKNNSCLLIEASARLLALVNQLSVSHNQVTLDMTESDNLFSYLDRNGFFTLLEKSIVVLPQPDEISASDIFRNANNGLVEFCQINPNMLDEDLPKALSTRFEMLAGTHYQAAFTFVAELYNNVIEHSGSQMSGFIGMQVYKGNRAHIQTVISDSGKGILGTIHPLINQKYPHLLHLSDSELLIKMLTEGNISSNPDEGRGQGFRASSGIARKYSATVTVRQSVMQIRLEYKGGYLISEKVDSNLQLLQGTHICFDFFIDS